MMSIRDLLRAHRQEVKACMFPIEDRNPPRQRGLKNSARRNRARSSMGETNIPRHRTVDISAIRRVIRTLRTCTRTASGWGITPGAMIHIIA